MASEPTVRAPILAWESSPAVQHQQAGRVVEDVLRYFQTMERAAMLRNNRSQVQHYQECWLTVCDAYYGPADVPAKRFVHTSTADVQGSHGPSPRPRWFVEKYSRPLVAVVARVTRRRMARGAAEYETVDVLRCGHEVEVWDAGPDAKPAKHRRCKNCVPNI